MHINWIKEYLDIVEVIVLVLMPDGTVAMINKKGTQMLGYSTEELEGKQWIKSIIAKESRKQVLILYEEMSHSGCSKDYESFIHTKDKEKRLVRWHSKPLRDEAGHLMAIISSGEDITEKKVLKERLANQEREARKQMIGRLVEVQEKERKEIAYDLHDNVGQILTTCKLLLEDEVAKDVAPLSIVSCYKHLQYAINEVRNISHRLSSRSLEDLGLEAAILEITEVINASKKIQVAFALNDREALKGLANDIKISLYRIIQEQLNNIIKHAKASQIQITIEATTGAVEMEIKDDGIGFDLQKASKGIGIKNIYNRVELHGGKTIISTSPGEGCIISIYLPIVPKPI